MTPTSPDNQSGFELPQPVAKETAPSSPSSETVPLQAEQQSKQAELPGAALPPSPANPLANDEPAGQTTGPVLNDPVPAASASSLGGTNPALADDVDLIEKEWVDKAKAIVERTREDPHQQNKQLNQFKADYMKKRYGKEVRLSDE